MDDQRKRILGRNRCWSEDIDNRDIESIEEREEIERIHQQIKQEDYRNWRGKKRRRH